MAFIRGLQNYLVSVKNKYTSVPLLWGRRSVQFSLSYIWSCSCFPLSYSLLVLILAVSTCFRRLTADWGLAHWGICKSLPKASQTMIVGWNTKIQVILKHVAQFAGFFPLFLNSKIHSSYCPFLMAFLPNLPTKARARVGAAVNS